MSLTFVKNSLRMSSSMRSITETAVLMSTAFWNFEAMSWCWIIDSMTGSVTSPPGNSEATEKNIWNLNHKRNYADSQSSSPILTPSTFRTKGLYPSLTANISKWMSSIWMLGAFHTWMFVLEQLCSKTETSHESSDILTIFVVTFFEDIAVTTIEQSRVCEFQWCSHYIDERILINEVVEWEPTSSLNKEFSFLLNS